MAGNTESARTNSESPALTDLPNKVAEPVAQASQRVYGHIATGVTWYFEHIEDLVHEAKHDRLAARARDASALADVLAGLPKARVISKAPGRIRLRVGLLRSQERLADEACAAIASVPGVLDVSASTDTGSVLIIYDAEHYKTPDDLLQALKDLRVRNGKAAVGPHDH